MFNQSLKLAGMELKNRVIVAPLAGVTDVPFRRICQEMGAGLTYVEMLSGPAIVHDDRRTIDASARHASEKILGVQVTGPNVEIVSESVRMLSERGFDTVDINMGCPVKKIVGKGWGAAMLQFPERISDTVAASRALITKPLSVKVRLGFNRDQVNVVDNVTRIVEAGADMVTIHGRTRSENYAIPVDVAGIKSGVDIIHKANPEVLKVANGDVLDYESAVEVLTGSGADAVMISRGVLGNPWIIRDLLLGGNHPPTIDEWLDGALRHMDYHESHYGRDHRLTPILARKHLGWYAHGYPDIKQLRMQLCLIDSIDQARAELKHFAASASKTLRRYEDQQGHQLPAKWQPSSDPKKDMDRTHDRGVGDREGEPLKQSSDKSS